jgi:hypothetical protein
MLDLGFHVVLKKILFHPLMHKMSHASRKTESAMTTLSFRFYYLIPTENGKLPDASTIQDAAMC